MGVAVTVPPGATEKSVGGLYTSRMEYDVNQNLVYLGRAKIGSLTSATVWQIRKFTYDVNNNPVSIIWANGSKQYNVAWDNRASLSYS